jgi:hypothetical protein
LYGPVVTENEFPVAGIPANPALENLVAKVDAETGPELTAGAASDQLSTELEKVRLVDLTPI